MTLWIYLHFPNLQLDTMFAEAPCAENMTAVSMTAENMSADTAPAASETAAERAAAPVVIVNGPAHQVVQASQSALKQGIKPGMGLGSAAALCSELQVYPYEADRERQAIEELAQWLYLLTCDIVLCPPQGLLLRVTNMLSLYAGLNNYWQALSQHLDQRQVRYHYASGFSPLAATLLAKSAADWICGDEQALRQRLEHYPLSATELDAKQIDKLARVGIRNIQALLALPMQEIARRFDIDLVNYVGRLLGHFKHPLSFYHPPQAFHAHLDLLYEIDNVQWLEKPLRRLLKRLEAFLTLRNQVAFELELMLQQRDDACDVVRFTSAQGEYQALKWSRLCWLSMESVQLTRPVLSLSLRVIRSGLAEQTPGDFFRARQGQQSSAELITLLQAKLGTEQVCKLLLSDDPRPELRSRYLPADQPVSVMSTPPQSLNSACHRASGRLRPSLRLPQPQPLQEPISLIHGPERIATGWWDGHNIIRDYFIARTPQGRWLWVFRTPEQQWFVHGQFS
ncbi:Y-family DNA polymerase [Vibrio ostreae]|uniref:DNA polymerase Y family protein n=1 Tax=Vibrio ostreae TaxID=2841925 RepID=A0A975YP57_9VIBR|nr:DNA polymerase Y family protein [Vibrio ostreae]QXO18241.1 DNA polymerase Y family protein [Vibrio ostreae]